MNFEKMLEDKNIRNVVIFLAVTNVLGYLAYSKVNAVLFFVLIGLITYFINKNITVVLLVPLFLTGVLMSTKKSGFQNIGGDDFQNTTGFQVPNEFQNYAGEYLVPYITGAGSTMPLRPIDEDIRKSLSIINKYSPEEARKKITKDNLQSVDLEFDPLMDPNNPELNVNLEEPFAPEPLDNYVE